MKRSTLILILLLACFLAICIEAKAQEGNMFTFPVTDGEGQVLASGTWTATLTRPAGMSVGTPQRMDGLSLVTFLSGDFSVGGQMPVTPIPRTDKITPAGYTWTFSICAQATFNCRTVVTPINSASIDLTSLFSAAIGTIRIPAPAIADMNKVFVRAYRDSEIVNPAAGTIYYNVISGMWRGYNGTSWANMKNGTLPFIDAKDDCNLTADGVAVDNIAGCASTNPTRKIYLRKIRSTACSSGSGGGCIGTYDYHIAASIILGDAQTLECESAAGWPDGGVKIKVDSGISALYLFGYSSKVHGCIFDAGNYWNFTVRTEYPNFTNNDLGGTGEDGVVLLGGETIVEQTAAYGFKRHGFFVAGHAAVVPVNGMTGQPDGYYINGVMAYSNRGWGIYIEGQDGNAGTTVNPKTTGNLLGGYFNNSFFGGVMSGHMSHLDNRNAMSAGANGTIATIQRTGGITTYTGTAVASTSASMFVTCSGTVNYNRTMYMNTFTSTSSFTLLDAGGDFALESAGTCHASSSTEVFAYYKTLGGDLAKSGCTAGSDGSSDQAILYDYCESNSSAPMYGNGSVVIAPHIGTLPAQNAYTGAWIQGLANGFLFTASQGYQFWNPTNGGNGFLDIRSGSVGGSTGSRGVRFIQHDNTTIDFRLFVLTTGSIAIDCGALNTGLTIVKTQYVQLSPCLPSQDIRFHYNNGAVTGKTQWYNDTTKTAEIDPAIGLAKFLAYQPLAGNPAQTGLVRLANGVTNGVYGRNNANTQDIPLISSTPTDRVSIGGANATMIDMGNPVLLTSVTFATLPASPVNGMILYCSDCTVANPTAAAGTGAVVKRINGVWVGN